MGRPPKWAASRRYHLTLEAEEADLLDGYADAQQKPVATVATRLLVAVLHRATSDEVDELTDARRQLEELRRANAGLRRRLGALDAEAEQETPRWEWPIRDLLADRDWWSAWLPRLHQLLGRRLRHHYVASRVEVLDANGYPDLLAFLFPPVRDPSGRVLAEWSSPYYPEHACREWEAGQAAAGRLIEAAAPPGRPVVWEPVIRHVAVALCALELTAIPGADPGHRIRTEEDLTGSWFRTLRRLAGTDAADLPEALT